MVGDVLDAITGFLMLGDGAVALMVWGFSMIALVWLVLGPGSTDRWR